MKPQTWPFRLEHITCDGEKYNTEEELNKFSTEQKFEKQELGKLNGVGIISNNYIEGVQTIIWAVLNSPVMIIEFSPDREPVRTGPKQGFDVLPPPCKAFRDCIGKEHCKDCDDYHALLFYGLEKQNLAENIQERIDKSEFIQKYFHDQSERPIFVDNKKRGYLKYDCPFLGYRELIFPIFFEKKVIAVLFVGQIVREDRLDFIGRKQTEFFRQNPSCLGPYCQNQPDLTPEIAQNAILEKHVKWARENIWDKTRYKTLFEKVNSELKELEKTMDTQMELLRERYVSQKLDLRTKEFRESLPTGPCTDLNSLNVLWNNVEGRMQDIVQDFDLRYLVIFGISNLNTDKVNVLDVVAKAGNIPKNLTREIDFAKFDLSQIPSRFLTKPTDSNSVPGLLNGLKGLNQISDSELNLLLLFPVPFHPNSSAAILVGYKADNPHNTVENRIGGYLYNALQSFDAIIFSALSSILAATAQNRAEAAKMQVEAAFRIFGHEAAQLTAGLEWMQFVYFSDVKRLRSLSEEKASDLSHDLAGCIKLLNLLFKKGSMLLSIPRANKTKFLAFKELLFKWENMYRLEANKKNLQFVIPDTGIGDPLRPHVYADKALLEQLVYNLVSNAVKYSYWGTKLYVDCKKMNAQVQSPHILTVTSYGYEMEQGDRPYELYSRGASVAGEPGLGIGLYIAKQIAKAHDGDIRHTCEKISDYNVPLIEAYIYRSLKGKSSELEEKLRHELENLKKAKVYHEIISSANTTNFNKPSYFELPENEICESIKKETYKITFSVKIPPKEE